MTELHPTSAADVETLFNRREAGRQLPCAVRQHRTGLLATVAFVVGVAGVGHAQKVIVEGDDRFTIEEGETYDWSSGPLIVRNEQNGELRIEGVLKNAEFDLGHPPVDDFTLQPLPGYEDILGTVVVSGKNALWEASFMSDADWQGFRIGYKSIGSLTIENGGTFRVSGADVTIGIFAGMSSEGTVSGQGATDDETVTG